jgi:hypothetical protein
MNPKAQISIVAFMLAVVIIILGLSFAFPVNEATTNAMNETSSSLGETGGMNCTGTTDDYVTATCWIADIGQAYFIGSIFALAGLVIAARVIWG